MAKRVLLTGVGGLVASHVLRHLMENTDWEIVGIDSFRHRGKTDRIVQQLDGLDKSRYINLVHDLTVPISDQLNKKIGHIDYVLNLASESHVDRSITDPRPFVENNVHLILTMLDWARIAKPEKFIQISTDEVYGPMYDLPHSEGNPHRPSNPYSASKSAQEDICYSYWRTFNVPIVITNTMNLFGAMQDVEKFIPMIIKTVNEGGTVSVHADKDGTPGTRFYLHARNQADALLFLLKNHTPSLYPATDLDRFNIVGEREISNLELAQQVAEYVGKHLKYKLVDVHSQRPGHDRRYGLDGAKLANLGWKAPIPYEESLRSTVEWTLRPENDSWLIT